MVLFIGCCLIAAGLGGCKHAVAPSRDSGRARRLPGVVCAAAPKNAQLLHQVGNLALFAGETEADVLRNAAARKADPECPDIRNSLFLRQSLKDGKKVWRLVLTSDGDWKAAAGMNAWCKDQARNVWKCFAVMDARLSVDGRGIWLVCNPHIGMYNLVCSFDYATNTFRVIGDGDTIDVQPDGTIRVKNKKTYLHDKNGESLGAAWYDEWIAPDGRVVRKTQPSRKALGEDGN